MRHRLPLLVAFALLTFGAAACKQPEPGGWARTDLTVVGGPVDSSGGLGVTGVKVEVLDSRGRTVRFNGLLVADPDGAIAELTLAPGEAPVSVLLSRGERYTFVANGYGTGGEFLAYGEAPKVVLTGGDNAVAIAMAGLLGQARLRTRTPVHALLPGQTLDVLLTVMPPGREDLVVPPADYEAEYEVHNGAALGASGLGIRLQAGARSGGDLVVGVEANGLAILGSRAHSGTVTDELRLPFATDVAVDMTPPTVTSLAFDPAQQALTGIADDDLGVVTVDVYDGPVLIATSDDEIAAEQGIPEVSFPGEGTGFVAYLQLPPGEHEVTVYVTDFSRNQGTASHTLSVR